MTTNTSILHFDRTYPLAPAKLWTLLTDARMRESWGAPSDDTVLTMEIEDLREGGVERHRCGPTEAPDFTVETRWYRLDGPALACFTETVDVPGMRLFTSLVTYTLTATADGTALAIDIALQSFTGEDATTDVQDGWTAGLAQLDALVLAEAAPHDA